MDMGTDRALVQEVQALFHRSSDLSCSDLASAFTALIPSDTIFEIALKVLLPILEGTSDEHLSCRIAAAFILYYLYTPHPLDINPFASSFRDAYASEKAAAQRNTGHPQLVWTLWKILRGEINEIASRSPEALAQASPDITALLNGSREDVIGDDSGVVSRVQPERQRTSTDLDDSYLAEVSRAVSLLLDARIRVLTLSEKKILTHVLEPVHITHHHHVDIQVQQSVIQCISSHDLTALVMKNPSVAHLVIIGLLSYPSTGDSPSSSSPSEVLSTLRSLPPTTASFETYGRLLQDVTCLSFHHSSFQDATFEEPKSSSASQAQPIVTIAEYIRTEALGAFLLSCIEWIDMASAEEREGFVSDDSVGRAVQLLCRFYNSLVKLGVLDPAVEADSAEMASFALRFSVYAEANALYRTLALSRPD